MDGKKSLEADEPAKQKRSLRDAVLANPAGKLLGKAYDLLGEPVARVATDIRQRVVEEATYGRIVTPELVKQVDQVKKEPAQSGIHGPAAKAADKKGPGIHGAPAKPAPETAKQSIEALENPENRPGMSFAEAVAEKYGWGKDFWQAKKTIAEHSHTHDQERGHGIDR